MQDQLHDAQWVMRCFKQVIMSALSKDKAILLCLFAQVRITIADEGVLSQCNKLYNKLGIIFIMNAVIGVSLKLVPTINRVPYPVYTLLERLSRNWSDIIVEGIFRIPGNMATVNEVIKEYGNGEVVDLDKYDIHTVASLLKAYIRQIPGMLITEETVC